MRTFAALLLAAILPVTSGCVAAAIPLAAGGLLAKGRAPATAPAIETGSASEGVTPGARVTRLALTELPPPDVLTAPRNPVALAFREYARAEVKTPPAAGKRPGALLSRASDLRMDRAPCTAQPLAVFIDLDPGRGTFDPLDPGLPDLALVEALNELRAQGVSVVWFSRLGAGFETPARAALAVAGYDAAGTDQLVMLSSLDERKQTRRDDMAKTLCPIALLGDERADFDELYLYLKRPDAALALDAMIGRGWFLASPFSPSAQAKDAMP